MLSMLDDAVAMLASQDGWKRSIQDVIPRMGSTL